MITAGYPEAGGIATVGYSEADRIATIGYPEAGRITTGYPEASPTTTRYLALSFCSVPSQFIPIELERIQNRAGQEISPKSHS